MTTYRKGWLAVGAALLLAGVAAAVSTSPESLPLAFVVGAVASLVMTRCGVRLRGTVGPRRARVRFVATSALVGGVTAGALVGFTNLFGQRAGLLVLVVLVSSPSALRTYRRWLRAVPIPSAAQLESLARVFANVGVGYVGVQPEPDPGELTDDELCQRWRASCLYLQQRPTTAHVIRAVEQRQTYLDEFERRYPGAFALWLTTGTGALDYLTPDAMRGRVDHTRIDWDELTEGRD